MVLPQNTAGIQLIVEGMQKFISDLGIANQAMAGVGKAAQSATKPIGDLGFAWNEAAKRFQLTSKSLATGRRDFVSAADAIKAAQSEMVRAVRQGGAEIAGIKWDQGLKSYILTASQTKVATKDAENAIRQFALNTGVVYAATTQSAQRAVSAQQQVGQAAQEAGRAAAGAAGGISQATKSTTDLAMALLRITGASQETIGSLLKIANVSDQASGLIGKLGVSFDRAAKQWTTGAGQIVSSQDVVKAAAQQITANFTQLAQAASAGNARVRDAALGLAKAERNVLDAFQAADKALQRAANATTDVEEANQEAIDSTLDYQRALVQLAAAQDSFNEAVQKSKPPTQLQEIGTAVAQIRSTFTGAVSTIKSFIGTLGGLIAAFGIAKIAAAGLHAVVAGLKGVFNALTSPIRKALESLQTLFRATTIIAFGVLIRDTIRGVIRDLKELASSALEAVTSFQTLTLRLEIMEARMLRDMDATLSFADSMEQGEARAKGLLKWIKELSLTAPFDVGVIGRTLSLNLAMGFLETQAKDLTEAILGYTAAMGLGPEIMERITFNLGQMKAAGKVTATEMRDLARGAFFPLTRVLDIAAQKLGIASNNLTQFRKDAAEGKIDVNTFFEAFIEMVQTDFPNAVEKFGQTLTGVRQRLTNFFKTILGLEILAPLGQAIARSMNNLLNVLLSPRVQAAARLYGRILVAGFEQVASVVRVFVIPALKDLADAIGIPIPTANTLAQTLANVAFGAAEGLRRLAGLIRKLSEEIRLRFNTLGTDMFSFGANIIKQLARGIVAGIKFVIRAISVVANVIRGLFETHSPPKILPELPRWGMEAMNEWLKGFTLADFDMLEGLQNPIEQVLQLLVETGEITEKEFGKIFVRISEDIAKVLAGKISPEKLFGDIAKSTGPFSKFLIELAKRQLELAKATDKVREAEERLERARQREQDLRAKLNKQIFQYNQAVRQGAPKEQLKVRLSEINATAKQAAEATKQVSLEEKRLEIAQKQMEFWEEQVQLQEKLVEQLIKLTEAQIIKIEVDTSDVAGAIEDALDDVSLGAIGADGLFPTDEEIQAKVNELFRNARKAIVPLFDTLAAEIKPIWELIFGTPVTLPKSVRGGKTVGSVGGVINDILEAFKTIGDWWDTDGSRMIDKMFLFATVAGGIIGENLAILRENISKTFGGEIGGMSWATFILGVFAAAIELPFIPLIVITGLFASASEKVAAFTQSLRDFMTAWDDVKKALDLSGQLLDLINTWMTSPGTEGEQAGKQIPNIWDKVKEAWTTSLGDLFSAIGDEFRSFFAIGSATSVFSIIQTFVDSITELFSRLSQDLVTGSIIPEMLDAIYQEFFIKMELTRIIWEDKWNAIKDFLVIQIAPVFIWFVDSPLRTINDYIGITLTNTLNSFTNTVLPNLVSYLNGALTTALTKLANETLPPLAKGFADIVTEVVNLTNKLQLLIDKINKLPVDKLKLIAKDSPSPFAEGLKASAREMRKLAGQALPQLASNLNAIPVQKQSVAAMPVSMAGASSFSNSVSVNMGGVNIMNGMDEAQFEAKVLHIVRRGIGLH